MGVTVEVTVGVSVEKGAGSPRRVGNIRWLRPVVLGVVLGGMLCWQALPAAALVRARLPGKPSPITEMSPTRVAEPTAAAFLHAGRVPMNPPGGRVTGYAAPAGPPAMEGRPGLAGGVPVDWAVGWAVPRSVGGSVARAGGPAASQQAALEGRIAQPGGPVAQEKTPAEDSETLGAGTDSFENDSFGEDLESEFAEKAKAEEVWDPFSGYNRAMTSFNDGFYVYVLDPMARGYRFVVPGF
ncbi:MAG: MlaA family lipoprotein, partial [Deltaproteobacteria bacterium]|nr:MlaA family lipoprotein [Deltaproteobacteria bacterium]